MAAREDDVTMFNIRFTKEMALWRNFSEVIFKWSPPRSTSFAARGPYQYHDFSSGPGCPHGPRWASFSVQRFGRVSGRSSASCELTRTGQGTHRQGREQIVADTSPTVI